MSCVISLNQSFRLRSLVADSEVGRKMARSFLLVNDRGRFDLQVEKEDIVVLLSPRQILLERLRDSIAAFDYVSARSALISHPFYQVFASG
jgi:predicted nucleic acid-binding OB-fold protein